MYIDICVYDIIVIDDWWTIFVEKEETPDYTPGIRQSGNAKITFNDNDYFKKVDIVSEIQNLF